AQSSCYRALIRIACSTALCSCSSSVSPPRRLPSCAAVPLSTPACASSHHLLAKPPRCLSALPAEVAAPPPCAASQSHRASSRHRVSSLAQLPLCPRVDAIFSQAAVASSSPRSSLTIGVSSNPCRLVVPGFL